MVKRYFITSILIILSCCIGVYLLTSISKADYVAKEMPTQANKQTDLFDKSVDNLADFTNKLEQGKQAGIDSLGGENGSPQGLSYLTKKNKAELEGEGDRLDGINEHELAGSGRAEIIKNDSINKLHRDYTRAGDKKHMSDAKTISDAQDDLLENLLGKLKDLGVDCKTVKGDKRVEPEYFLQTRTSDHKDTIYNQALCEELRNSYNCKDTLTTRCTRRAVRYHPWQNHEMLLDGPWVYWTHMGWLYPIKWKRKRYGLHMRSGHPVVMAELRVHISQTTNIPIEKINPHIHFEARGEGHTHNVWDDLNTFDKYRIKYQTRESYEVCEEWQDDWTERCYIK